MLCFPVKPWSLFCGVSESDVAALRTEDGSGFEFWLFESLVEKKREHITHPMLVPGGMQFTRSEFRLPM